MKLQAGGETIHLRPFLWVGVLWAAASLALVLRFSARPDAAALIWFTCFALALTNLFFLVKTIAALIRFMSDQVAETRTASAIQAFIFGGLKLICLGVIGVSIWKFPKDLSLAAFFGLSTLVALPLGGGVWWSWTKRHA